MEVALRTPTGGRVREVLAAVGAPVDAGSPLFRIETKPAGIAVAGAGRRADFAALAAAGPGSSAEGVAAALAEMGNEVVGYDYGEAEASRIVAAYLRLRVGLPPGDGGALRGELAVLNAFVDVVALSRNRRTGADEGPEAVHSPGEFFHAFLETMDTARAGLPVGFVARLRDAVAAYGVDGLDRTPALEDAAVRPRRLERSGRPIGQHASTRHLPAAADPADGLAERRGRRRVA